MAFLGSLGKALGLDSEFGKGLVTGTARGFTKSFQDDIDRTKNNIDNMVQTSFKTGLSEKKRYDAEVKENLEIVEQIISNLGGTEGNLGKDVLLAADGLVNQFGLTNALEYSKNAANASFYGMSPLQAVEIAKKFDHKTPITASFIAKRKVEPINIPDVKQLGKDAAVGIMKADFLGGDPDFMANEGAKKAESLLKAAGVDINDSGSFKDLPPATKVKLDPLVLGMNTDPYKEINRLQIFSAKLKPNDPDYVKKQNRIKNMIDFNRIQIQKQAELKRLGTIRQFNFRDFMALDNNVADILVETYDFDATPKMTGGYLTLGDSEKQRTLINNTKRYYSSLIAQAIATGPVDLDQNQMVELQKAILNNKKVTIVDGKLQALPKNYLSDTELALIKKKSSAIGSVEEENLSIETLDNLVTRYKQANDSRGKTNLLAKIRNKIEKENPTFSANEIDKKIKDLGIN